MANYNYDEGGNMSAYFVITCLIFILIPLTISSIPPKKPPTLSGCPCQPCVEQRQRIANHEKGSILNPKLSRKVTFVLFGWSLVAYMSYRVIGSKLDNTVYDPFEILGIKMGTPEKEIKSHYKKLSRMYHPDKVRATVNETLEIIQDRFVKITKAYKSLTDETIRKNWEEFGHPDGRQETSMGIAIPRFIIEAKNNIWILGFYGLAFGGGLPAVVGKWWFGSRQKTKDGINARSAATFFKDLKEDSRIFEVIGALGKSFEWEHPKKTSKADEKTELDRLEKEIASAAGKSWGSVKSLAGIDESDADSRRRSMILLYAHLLRLDIRVPSLRTEQTEIVLQTPALLNALIGIAVSRNHLGPTVWAMRLYAFITQAIIPETFSIKHRLAQLPGIKTSEVLGDRATIRADDIKDVATKLEEKNDGRVVDVKKAVEKWPRLEILDAAYKVIGERIVTPSSIVYLVVKLRISPPNLVRDNKPDLTAEQVKKNIKVNEERDNKFLMDKKDAEDIDEKNVVGYAHAPYWPANRRPGWWLVLADDKTARIVVPPMKITNVPYANPNAENERDYRSYKIQFQAPSGTGSFTWKIYLISDTFVGEEVSKTITLQIEDVSALEADEPAEDDISDPEEDSLAGQMAAMRGGSVKKDENDEESSTDDDEDSDDDSSSDDD
ncbi:hypothetical protein E1B28_003910 [Marasmius oreades]|uniref:J domain-containing protein n=1 Tax=Marasmius oreades TaxID=181124 RepID=A0A9P8ABV5_9AGAR|nr:uncharacterized protein E1B28_003910 [Marasmius oreades]KAG7096479.1 hypothetical protein E1B28_003910 [Marasmius oreades]